jgi:hypothetical protein
MLAGGHSVVSASDDQMTPHALVGCGGDIGGLRAELLLVVGDRRGAVEDHAARAPEWESTRRTDDS